LLAKRRGFDRPRRSGRRTPAAKKLGLCGAAGIMVTAQEPAFVLYIPMRRMLLNMMT
jgi:hypothetical protein